MAVLMDMPKKNADAPPRKPDKTLLNVIVAVSCLCVLAIGYFIYSGKKDVPAEAKNVPSSAPADAPEKMLTDRRTEHFRSLNSAVAPTDHSRSSGKKERRPMPKGDNNPNTNPGASSQPLTDVPTASGSMAGDSSQNGANGNP